MQNQQGLNINGNYKNGQDNVSLTQQIGVNKQFDNNEELNLGGFDFGLSQDDWGNKNADNNILNEIEQTNNNDEEFEYDFAQINNNEVNKSLAVNDKFDEFQTFDENDTTNINDQSNNKNSFFMEQQNKQSSQMRQKRLRLQGLYKISKGKLLSRKYNNQQQSELQQLVKYNQMNFKTNNINTNTNNFTNTLSFSNNNNNSNKIQQQQQQKDFFAFTKSNNYHEQEYKQYQEEEENEFAVFDRPSLFGNKQYHSTYVQQSRDEPNSPSNLLYNSKNNNDNELFSNFQTQILLSAQSGIIGFSQQQNPAGIQIKQNNNKIFSTKFIPLDLVIIRLIISVISITAIALLYGFMNCIFIVIVHDFLPALFLIKEVIKTNKIKNINENNKKKQNYHNVNNTTTTIDMNQLSLSDELETPSQLQKSQQTKISSTFSQYKQQLQSSIKLHKYIKYALYISSISMFIFILVQITQLDTFFTANYFSFSNWGHVIVVAVIYIVEFWVNCKLNRKIDQVMFYEENYLRSSHQNQ